MKRFGGLTIFVATVVIGGALGLALTGVLDELQRPKIVISDPLPGAVIVVSIDGAVATPGVYELPADARLAHLLEDAGGAASNADLAQVNLAARLADEQQVTVPTMDPERLAGEVDEEDREAPSSFGIKSAGDSRLNLNTASESELDGLPGIGPVLAQLIVEEREKSGRFGSVDDLVRIPGISQRMVDELRDRITT